MKIFAFFLPQFHEIKENNQWWGNGFTEWINVKKSKPLFEGHIQPKEPLNNNYYNLLDINTVKWQTELLKNYSIDGLIYYHYYFNGRLLLEKPAENLLKNKEINQNYFFCWANHSWIKSWEGKKDVLIEQTYGKQSDWEKHFKYLLPFFKDKRYEKKDNMPLFMIFNSNFSERKEMFEYYDRRCKESGFDGLYLIETFHGTEGKLGCLKTIYNKTKVTKKIFIRQPSEAQRFCANHKKVDKRGEVSIYDGNDLYTHMIKQGYHSSKIINGAFFEWDNTPRHKERGYIITSPSYEKFEKYIQKNEKQDYVFINAWNEWAEGMVLEPTKENSYKYLEWIKKMRNLYNI